jgi:uncharacterized protein YdbL (DUF1318 family)
MKGKMKFLAAVFLFALVSCAVITVNIYFPEKDVKEAYKALEKELMGTEATPGEKKPEGKPESSIRFQLFQSAYAADVYMREREILIKENSAGSNSDSNLSEKIADAVKKMPDVVNAYKEMGARIADIDRLRESGVVGEGNKGLLVVREGTLTPADQKLVSMENENRKTVMNGMTKAIIRINRVPENEANLKQVGPQAVDQFAAIRRDSAKKGWWIQDVNGNWARK